MLSLQSGPFIADASPDGRRAFENQLIGLLPDLKKFARSLTRNAFTADDLVQDTIIRALRSYLQFEMGTNLKAYTFRIMRNCFLSDLREQRLEPADCEAEAALFIPPSQDSKIELDNVIRALGGLVKAHREVISLIRVNGYSYLDAANIMRCELGTIKSRMNRADAALRDALGPEFGGQSSKPEPSGLRHYPGRAPDRIAEVEYAC
jgi:RNA polymerase sigma-70 factor (ECF subfamily)